MFNRQHRTNTSLIIFGLVSLIAGYDLLVHPKEVHHIVIRCIGILWILDGILYGLTIYRNYLEKKNTDKWKN